MALKTMIHRAALRTETFLDRAFHRTGTGREIDSYIGYSTPEQIILRGRVLSALRHASPKDTQSRFQNFRQIFGMFLTDEARDVTVRCEDVTAQTDEEGYFALALPRRGQSGWDTAQVSVDGGEHPTVCPIYVTPANAKFMVISDIDDTMLETGAYSLVRNLLTSFTGNAKTRKIFSDSKQLVADLTADGRNPVFYVSSSPWNLHDFLADIFTNADLVRGPMFLRDLGLSETKFITEGHSNHKGASIAHILRANPDLPAILLGDTGQHDAHIYRDVIVEHPDRIIAVGLRTPGPGMDDADRADLEALKATGVPSFAAPDFTEMMGALTNLRPELFDVK